MAEQLTKERIDDIFSYINMYGGSRETYWEKKGNIWFIGPEETGDPNVKSIDDLINVCLTVDDGYWENHQPLRYKSDRTLDGIAYMLYTLSGHGSFQDGKIDYDTLEEIKSKELGKKGNYLFNLLPLKNSDISPATFESNYAKFSNYEGLEFLQNRESYQDFIFYKTSRMNRIKELMKNCSPQFVIFYGKMDDPAFDDARLMATGTKSWDEWKKRKLTEVGDEKEVFGWFIKKKNTVIALIPPISLQGQLTKKGLERAANIMLKMKEE